MDEADAKGIPDGRKVSITNLVIEMPTAGGVDSCCMASVSSPQRPEVSLSLVQPGAVCDEEGSRERRWLLYAPSLGVRWSLTTTSVRAEAPTPGDTGLGGA